MQYRVVKGTEERKYLLCNYNESSTVLSTSNNLFNADYKCEENKAQKC